MSGVFLILSVVTTPPHCLLDSKGPGCTLGEISTRTLHQPKEAGHMGEGSQCRQVGCIIKEGRIAQVQGHTGILRGCGKAGRGKGMIWSKWVEDLHLENNISTTSV